MRNRKRRTVADDGNDLSPSIFFWGVEWSVEGMLRNTGQTLALIIAMLLCVHSIKSQLEINSRAADSRARIQVEAIESTVAQNNAQVLNIVTDTRATEAIILAKLEDHGLRFDAIAKKLNIRYPEPPPQKSFRK